MNFNLFSTPPIKDYSLQVFFAILIILLFTLFAVNLQLN